MSGHEGYTESGYYEQALADLRKCKAERNRAHEVLSKVYEAVMEHSDDNADLEWQYQGSNLKDFNFGMQCGRTDFANKLALILLEKDDV